MALQVLKEGVRTRLQSGVAITSVAQCVEELVENCIDAGASCIAVRIDLSRYKMQVVDNGKGISSDDLKLVGERYATSKCHTLEDLENLEYFGYRGEALASLIDVSGTVEICSRHALSSQTYSKVFHNGKSVGVSLTTNHRSSIGTTVIVHDFFYNLPVRRKGISDVLELEKVKNVVECIALVNPKISLSVRDDKVGECVLQTHKSQSVLTSFRHMFGSKKALAMKEVSIVNSCFRISGFMSTEGHHNKALQFMYINGRVVKNSLLHGCVNSLLANSMVAKKLSRQSGTSWPSKESSGEKTFLSPKRTPEKYGTFVLMIDCPRSEYDICLDPAKTLVEFKQWDDVLSTLECLVKKFLVDYNLALGPATFGTQNWNDGSAETPVDSDLYSSRQPSPDAVPSPYTSKFSRKRVAYDIQFPGAVQSQTVRQQNTSRHDTSQQATVPTNSSPYSEPEVAGCTPLHVTSGNDRPLLPQPSYNSDSTCVDDSCTVDCDCLSSQSVACLQSTDPGTCLHVDGSCCEMEGERTLHQYPLRHCSLSYPDNGRRGALRTDVFDGDSTNRFDTATLYSAATGYSVSYPASLAHQSSNVPVTHIPGSQSWVRQHTQVSLSVIGPEPVLSNADDHVSSLSCKASDPASIARSSSSGVAVHNIGRDVPSKPLLGLNTPHRSPLQSCNLSSKLARLLHKGKSAQISQQKLHTNASIKTEECGVAPLTKALITPGKPLCRCTNVCGSTTLSCFDSIVHSCSGKPTNTNTETFSFPSAHQRLPLVISHLPGSSQRSPDCFSRKIINSNVKGQTQKRRCHVSTDDDHSINCNIDNLRGSVSCPSTSDGDHFSTCERIDVSSSRGGCQLGLQGWNRGHAHHQSYLLNENLTESVYAQAFVPNAFIQSQLHEPLQPSHQKEYSWNHPPTNTTVLVTTSVPHLGLETQSVLSAKKDTAHTDVIPSVGSDFSNFHLKSKVDDGVSDVCSSVMHLSGSAQSIQSWPAEMCSSATYSHPLISHVDHPMSHIDQTMSHVVHPMLCVHQPLSHVGQPTSRVDQPMSCIDQLTSHVNQPMSNLHQSVCAHFNQPLSCISQPTSHTSFHQQPEPTHVFPPDTYSHNRQSRIAPTRDSLNVCSSSSSSADEKGAQDQHRVGSNPMWKETTNLATGESVYIHSATGKCTAQKPATFTDTSTLCATSESMYQQVGCGTYIPDNCVPCTSDKAHANPGTLKVKPLRAAPHLSHDFSAFIPRPKRQRILSSSLSCKPSSSDTGNAVNSLGGCTLSLLADTKQYGSETGSKWRHRHGLEQLELKKGFGDETPSVAGMLEGWENPTFQVGHQDIPDIGVSGCERGQIRVHRVINHYKFSREMFQNVRVLGQVDSKFIACLMDKNSNGRHNLLVVIDQHAAHERVRLEALTADLWEDGIPSSGSSGTLAAIPPTAVRMKSSLVHPPILISLQPSEIRLAKHFRKQLEAIGVFLEFLSGTVVVYSLPSVLVQREASEVRRGRPTVALDILQEMIVKHVELLQTTSGGCSTLPSAISNVLNSQACHGAIKFGDPLTLEECEALVQSLAQCKLPFQCAHGRPALMPILDLDILLRRYPTQEVQLPELKKLTHEI